MLYRIIIEQAYLFIIKRFNVKQQLYRPENRSIALFEEKKAPDSVFVFVVIPIVK